MTPTEQLVREAAEKIVITCSISSAPVAPATDIIPILRDLVQKAGWEELHIRNKELKATCEKLDAANEEVKRLTAAAEQAKGALEDAVNIRAKTREWRTDSPEVTGNPERWVRDDYCSIWRSALAALSAALEKKEPSP